MTAPRTQANHSEINQPKCGTWVLNATSVELEDAAVSVDEARALVEGSPDIGNYLRQVQALVVSRYDLGELGHTLPSVDIVITTNDDNYETCRLLRRGSRFLLDPDNLLRYSRANVSDDWRRRGQENPRRALPFIASLFEVRLLNLTSSVVVNACAFSEDEELRNVVRRHYERPVKANAANAARNSSLARRLRDEADVGLARANPSAAVRQAYSAIQELTNRQHRQINTAIQRVFAEDLDFTFDDLALEYRPFGDHRELRVDLWYRRGERPATMEFTHRRDNDATLPTVSTYVLEKVQAYARDYGLI